MEKRFQIIIFFLFILSINVIQLYAEPAVEWEIPIGGPAYFHVGSGVDQTDDGGYIVVGYIDTTSTGGDGVYNIYLVKVSSQGRIGLSKKISDTTGETSGKFVQQTDDGGYIISGTIDLSGWGIPTNVYMVKTDSNRAVTWTRSFGIMGDGNSVYQTKDGGYILAGGTSLIKTSSLGGEQWRKSFTEYVMFARQTVDEGFILVTGGQLVKINSTGITDWSTGLGFTANSVQQTSDGGYIVTGGAGSIQLAKITAGGSINWVKSFSDPDLAWGNSVQETFDGGYIIAGTARTDDDIDVYVIRTDVNGTKLWDKQLGGGGPRGDYGNHVERTDDGGYIVVGYSDSFGTEGVSDMYLIKIAPDTVPPSAPAEFDIYDLVISPLEVEQGQNVSVSVKVSNVGEETGSHTVDFRLDGGIVDSQTVTLDGGDLTTINFITSSEVSGNHTVTVDGLSGSFGVRGTAEPEPHPDLDPAEPAPIPEPEPEPETPHTLVSLHISNQRVPYFENSPFSGSINPAVQGEMVTITRVRVEDGLEPSPILVETSNDGSFSGTIDWSRDARELSFPTLAGIAGNWRVMASWSGNSDYEGSSSAPIYVMVLPKKPGLCFIATATYGSELSPEVQFLRGFRDNTVLSTYAGSNFMKVFNSFYYSFSPSVASIIASNEGLRGVMKVVLYPLIGILHFSSSLFSFFSFLPELGVVVAGLVASSLIALVYFMPGLFLLYHRKRSKPTEKMIRPLGLVWVGSLVIMVLANVTKTSLFMMTSTGVFVLVTMGLVTLISVRSLLDKTPFLCR